MRRCDRGRQRVNPSNLKGHIENGSPLPCPAPGPVLLLEVVWFRPCPAGVRGR
nr:MAG TPA: hypothetical protein [Caudoviricetes sp.]